MRELFSLVVLVAANLTGTSFAGTLAGADGAAEATLSWRLDFGGAQAPDPGYGLAVGYRGYAPDPVAGALFQVDVDGRRAFARVAGLPLFERNFRAELDDASEGAAPEGTRPWYARQWVLWTAGGLATTAALIGGGGGGSSSETDGNNCTGSPCTSGNVGPVEFDGNGDVGTSCSGSDCVVCPDGDVVSDCDREGLLAPSAHGWVEILAPDRARWLDAGTGHMGDLAAR